MDEWPERWESFGGSTCTWLAWVKRTNQMDRDGCAVTRSAGTYLLLVYPFKGTLSFARLSTSYLLGGSPQWLVRASATKHTPHRHIHEESSCAWV